MYEIFWLIFFGVLLLIEILTLGLATIWFAAGALVACLMAALNLPLLVQVIAFLAVSILMLIFTRPIMTKHLNAKTTKTKKHVLSHF